MLRPDPFEHVRRTEAGRASPGVYREARLSLSARHSACVECEMHCYWCDVKSFLEHGRLFSPGPTQAYKGNTYSLSAQIHVFDT